MAVGDGCHQSRARCGEDGAGRASLLRQLRRAIDPERHLDEADRLSQRAARRPCRHGNRPPAAARAGRFSRSAPRDWLRPRRERYKVNGDRKRRCNCPCHRAGRSRNWPGPRQVCASGLRDSGCSSAISPTARSAHLSPDAICSKAAAACTRRDAPIVCIRKGGRPNGRAC